MARTAVTMIGIWNVTNGCYRNELRFRLGQSHLEASEISGGKAPGTHRAKLCATRFNRGLENASSLLSDKRPRQPELAFLLLKTFLGSKPNPRSEPVIARSRVEGEIVTDNRHRLLLGLLNLLKIIDLLAVIASFGLSTVLIVHAQKSVSLAAFLSMRTKISNFLIFLSLIYICHLIFQAFGLYKSRRLSTRRAELVDILKATTLSSAFFVLISVILTIRMVTLPFVLIFWMATTLVLCGSRVAFRISLFHLRAHGRNLRHLLIFWNQSASRCLREEDCVKPRTRLSNPGIRRRRVVRKRKLSSQWI